MKGVEHNWSSHKTEFSIHAMFFQPGIKIPKSKTLNAMGFTWDSMKGKLERTVNFWSMGIKILAMLGYLCSGNILYSMNFFEFLNIG